MSNLKKILSAGLSVILTLGTYSPVFAGSLYSDVSDSDIDFQGIKYCKEHGIMTGTDPTTFNPTRSVTRGEMITMLWRMEGYPSAPQNGFSDVPADSFYKSPSNWAKASGVMTGNLHEDGSWTFDGQNGVTKEQVSLIMYRYAKNFKGGAIKGNSSLPGWAGSASPWAREGVEWALSNNIARYSNESSYPLAENAPRSWVATFMQRFQDPSSRPSTNPGAAQPENPAPSTPGNGGSTTPKPNMDSAAILNQFLASKGYASSTQGKTGLQYVLYDLNKDGTLELLIQKNEGGGGFFSTWTFMISGSNVVPILSDYGYGMYRYSPSYNAVIVSSDVRPSKYASDCEFMALDSSGYHNLFTLIADMGQLYKILPDGTRTPISVEENQAHFTDQVRFDWKDL